MAVSGAVSAVRHLCLGNGTAGGPMPLCGSTTKSPAWWCCWGEATSCQRVPLPGWRARQAHALRRWFTLEDVPLLEDDVDAMRVLFFADGEGVPRDTVTAITAPLDELLTVMALDTPTLAANFRQVPRRQRLSLCSTRLPDMQGRQRSTAAAACRQPLQAR